MDSLCSNMLSDNEQLRDISSIGKLSSKISVHEMYNRRLNHKTLFTLPPAAQSKCSRS